MPEYLAPGVYVEETSFRSKSIEGVGTSTTAFVGPARKGPIATTQRDPHGNLPAPPELLTSFGDFVRIYGGLEDLELGGVPRPNYLAHGVLNFFGEGGGRLYVSRVANSSGRAFRVLAEDAAHQPLVALRARFPGSAGNGSVAVREVLSRATGQSLAPASEGAMLRAHLAEIAGSVRAPFAPRDGSVLRLTVDGNATNVTFRGRPVAIRSTAALPASLSVAAGAQTITVRITDHQTITLRPANYTPASFLLAVAQRLRAATARLATGGEVLTAPTAAALGNELVIEVSSPTLPIGLSATTDIAGLGFPVGLQGGSQQVAVRSTAPLPNTIQVAAGQTLTVDITQTQVLALPSGSYAPADFVTLVGNRLAGATCRLASAGDVVTAPTAAAVGNEIVITTTRRGFAVLLEITTDIAGLAFPGGGPQSNLQAIDNTVANLAAVTIREIDDQLGVGTRRVNALTGDDGRLLLRADQVVGNPAPLVTLRVEDATNQPPGTVSAHPELGLTAGTSARGLSGVTLFFIKANGTWTAEDNVTTFALPAAFDPTVVIGEFLTLTVVANDADGESSVFEDLSPVATSPRYIGSVLARDPPARADALLNLFWLQVADTVTPYDLHRALFAINPALGDELDGDDLTGITATFSFENAGGTDGAEPDVLDDQTDGSYAAAFAQLRGLEDISIIAAPGHSAYATYRNIQRALIAHVELPRAYRIAVLDTPARQMPGEARDERAQIDTTRAALYYPWVTVPNPLARPNRPDQPKEINLPPSAFLCGVYARNDVEQDVAKAPANEVVRGALRFESDINFAQNQLLNPLGVNCLRFFPGRGYRVWGARTASSDPEWKYVPVRRYFIYLEASIDRGTQWAVFEKNGPRLWQNIRETVEDFLYNEWISNRLLGDTPKEAFFVRCDRSTMTQNDLDNGRLICLIGVAVLKPAEFVIFRIGQKTADARS